jgi:flavin-binding protein dodecin
LRPRFEEYSRLNSTALKFRDFAMTNMLKVIEVIAESDKGWEAAAAKAVARAGKTVNGIKSIYIKDMQAKVQNNKIVMYRINANISFMLD